MRRRNDGEMTGLGRERRERAVRLGLIGMLTGGALSRGYMTRAADVMSAAIRLLSALMGRTMGSELRYDVGPVQDM